MSKAKMQMNKMTSLTTMKLASHGCRLVDDLLQLMPFYIYNQLASVSWETVY